MKHAALIPLVAAAAVTAIVIPDEATARELVVETERKAGATLSSWWDRVPSPKDVEGAFDEAYDAFAHRAGELGAHLREAESGISDFLFSPSPFSDDDGDDVDAEDKPGHGHHGHRSPVENLTVYQVIQASNHTKKFASLVNDYPDIVDALNGTDAGNVTLFVPTDAAFDKIPDHGHGEKPPKEFLEKLVQYHVVPGLWPAGRILAHHTLPTALKDSQLGDRPQRLRVSVGIFGVRINFFGKLVAANVETKNGVIHAVDSILIPPPPAGKLISLFPSKFSTLLLAADKTGLTDKAKDHDHNLTGLTTFAPTNAAFQKLGPAANAFLFNSEKGLHYLKALLLYHIVANETLYSDTYYGATSNGLDGLNGNDDYEGEGDTKNGHTHVDLPSLLHGKHLSVDISRWHRLISIRVNGRTKVSIQDALARDGVVQVVDNVLFPPHSPKGSNEVDGEIGVEELIERLRPLVEDEPKANTDDEWVGEL